MKHMLSWRPGEYGKGLVHDGAVHTWGVGPNQDGSPTHLEYAQLFGLNEEQFTDHKMLDTSFGIDSKGALNVYDDNGWSSHPENEGKVAAQVVAVDPRLYVPNKDKPATWNFLGVAKNDEKWQFVKMGMPVGKDYWQDWHTQLRAPGEPDTGELYHGTSPARLESIMQHGLRPWDDELTGGTNYGEGNFLRPRPGHIYMAQNPRDAMDRGLDSSVEDFGPGTSPIVFKVNPAYLHPEHINPDEDDMLPAGNNVKQKDYPGYDSLGNLADGIGWGDIPSETQRQISQGHHVAYRGVIPPEALTPGHFQDGGWEPIEWSHTAALIGDMRDGWGRFATTAPWELGKSGKGLYYSETGVLQTWGDDRTYPDVWYDDENASQGNAHHLILRPNGTVRDQGAMNRNFENVEGDTEGLRQALRELDPRLRLDAPSEWDFGHSVTEPLETEPSSISRGEEGGKDSPTLQTSNDFAGSL